MTIKSILCIFGGLENELNAANTALALARAHGSHIRFLHLSSNPDDAYTGFYGEGIIVSGAIAAEIKKDNKMRLEKARQHVLSLTAKHHIPLDEPESSAHHASATFRHVVGMRDAAVAREGRLSDLIVIGHDDKLIYDAITPALFNTGRPVLLIPSAQKDAASEWQDKTVALAWNGSLRAARALYNAIPLIANAEKVYVLVAREHEKAFDLEAESGVMEYLRIHGFNAEISVSDRGDRPVGETLLAKAKKLGADLLVMGAYSHSMFREMVLGGVTEHMLEKADIPLLLSH